MKKNSLLFLLSLILVLSACDSENVGALYDDGGVTKFAFANSEHNIDLVVEQSGILTVPIYRTSTKGTASVEVALSSDDEAVIDIFTLSNPTVTFKDGEAMAYVNVIYPDIETVSPTASFSFDLTITNDEVVSPTKINQVSVKAGRKLTFEEFGVGTFSSEFFEEEWEQPILKAKEGEVYKLVGVYVSKFDFVFAINEDNTVSFSTQETGYVDDEYGMVSFSPFDENDVVIGSTKDDKTITLNGSFMVKLGIYGTYAEVLTLP